MQKEKQKYNNGYAILFTVVIVNIISLISMGLMNAAYKQLLLSSLAKDSQIAFYEADMATDCAYYIDTQTTAPNTGGISSISCGVDSAGALVPLSITPAGLGDRSGGYQVAFSSAVATNPCFTINVLKNIVTSTTTITSKGYNVCNLAGPRTVERANSITY